MIYGIILRSLCQTRGIKAKYNCSEALRHICRTVHQFLRPCVLFSGLDINSKQLIFPSNSPEYIENSDMTKTTSHRNVKNRQIYSAVTDYCVSTNEKRILCHLQLATVLFTKFFSD